MNRIHRLLQFMTFIAALLYAPVIQHANAQTISNDKEVCSQSNQVCAQTLNHTNHFDNRIDSLKTRQFACTLNRRPASQYESVYSTQSNSSELPHIHAPAVITAGKDIIATDGFSTYLFNNSNKVNDSIQSPFYTSENMILGATEQSIIQKHRIDKQSCVTQSPLAHPDSETSVFCSETYYKAQYHNDAVYILSDIPCQKDKSKNSCKDKAVSLQKYLLDGNQSWNVTLNHLKSPSIVGKWRNIILILSADDSLSAVDTETGSVIYQKSYASELPLDKDFYQFNHFYVDHKTGLFIVAARHHNIISVIDINTGSLIKTHDFGKAYAHNKFLEEDYHYIELGDFSFPLNAIMGIDNGIIFLRKDKNVLAAIELKTGKELWKYDIFNSPLNTDTSRNREDIAYHIGDILITDDLVILGYHKYATALNKTSGDVIWNYSFFPFNGHFGYQMWLSCIDNQLIVQSDNIYLYPTK